MARGGDPSLNAIEDEIIARTSNFRGPRVCLTKPDEANLRALLHSFPPDAVDRFIGVTN